MGSLAAAVPDLNAGFHKLGPCEGALIFGILRFGGKGGGSIMEFPINGNAELHGGNITRL